MYNRRNATSGRVREEYRHMDYHHCVRCLHKKARGQKKYPISNRDRLDLCNDYVVHLHTDYVWVPKRAWDKLDERACLQPENYPDKVPYADDQHTYAVPVPGTAIHLRLYATDIVTFNPDGSRILRANGHEGPTTLKWLHPCTGSATVGDYKPGLWDKSVWAVLDRHGRRSRFYDGIVLDANDVIETEIKPVPKRGIDKAKAAPWHAAVRHLRKHAAPFVAMLEGLHAPDPLADQLRSDNQYSGEHFWSEERLIEYILTCPEEPDHLFLLQLCMEYRGAAWLLNRLTNTEGNFERHLRTLTKHWIRANALTVVSP